MPAKKRKGQNSAVAKNNLVKMVEQIDARRAEERWANTEEGQQTLWATAHFFDVMSSIQFGQRIWKKVLVEDIDTHFTLDVQCKVTHYDGASIQGQIITITQAGIPDKTFQSCEDWDGIRYSVGDILTFEHAQLKKNIAKTTRNIWWQVK